MPPLEADEQPDRRASATATAAWIRDSLKRYESEHAGEPGHVTVRRLTSAEYAYAIRDLTGIDVKVGIDTSSDSVGGEGFANFGDVQFVQDESIERYLEAAKLVADHAVIGAGPLEFYADPGKTGLELSALNRINELYATKGFRVVSGEGGRPFGLERYGKALYVAWYYKHRVALGDPERDDSRARRQGRDHRPLRRSHLDGGRTSRTPPIRRARRSTAGQSCRRRRRHRRVAGEGARRLRRDPEVPDHLAQLVLRARRSRGRRRRRREPAGLRRRDAEGRADAPLRLCHRRARRPRPRRAVDARTAEGTSDLQRRRARREHDAGVDLAQPADRDARVRRPGAALPAARPQRRSAAARRRHGRARAPGRCSRPRPLRESLLLAPEAAAALAFGTSPDGTAIGPDDFATTGTVSFTIEVPAGPATSSSSRPTPSSARIANAVVRVMLSDRPEGTSRDALQRVRIRRPAEHRLRDVPRQHGGVRRAAAAELARRGESGRQGSGAGAVRQHLQQPRARRVRAEGEVPAQRQVLHREHGRRRRSRAAQPGLERSVRRRGRTTTPISACSRITTA